MRLIKHDAYDEQAFTEGRSAVPTLEKQIADSETQVLPDLLGDTFHGLSKRAPQFVDTPTISLQEVLLRELMETKEFDSLRNSCGGDAISTAIATDILGRELKPQLHDDILERMDKEMKIIQDDQEALEKLENLEGLVGDPEIDPEALAKAIELARATKSSTSFEVTSIPGIDPDDDEVGRIRRAFRVAAGKAATEVERFQEAVEGLGGTNTGSLKEKLALANHLKRSPKLQKLIEISGRLRRMSVAKRASVVREIPEEIVGIKMGDNLLRTLPSEMMLLMDPETEMLFWQKYVDGELMNYDLSGQEKQGDGPIIALVDSSGSMTHSFPGSGSITREVWSKAMVLGLAAVAEREKRDLLVCHFGDVGELKSWTFPYASSPEKVMRQDLIACLEFFYASENDIDGALRWAAGQLDPPEGRWGKADIILITDAEHSFAPGFPAEWAALKDKLKFTTYGVLIQSDPRWEENMRKVADHATTVRNLATDEDGAMDMLFKT